MVPRIVHAGVPVPWTTLQYVHFRVQGAIGLSNLRDKASELRRCAGFSFLEPPSQL